jgi:fibronectin-binding autotransporter adhesin
MNSNGGIMKQALFSIAIMVSLGLISGNVMAQTTRTWDGGSSANNSGSWQTNANWSSDTKPASGEIAALGDVTSGTRTVTNEAAETVYSLAMTQNSGTGTNKLLLNANLTLNNPGWVVSQTLGAGVDNMVINLNGYTNFVNNNGWKNHILRGTWDMSTPGSAIISQNGNDTMSVYGRLLMGSNTTITIARNTSFGYFNNYGTVTFQGNGVSEIGRNDYASSGLFSNQTSAAFTVGDGTDTPTARLRCGHVSLINAAGATVTVNAGATLSLYTDSNPGNMWSDQQTKMVNSGTFNLTGKLLFRPNSWNLAQAADKDDIDNDGVWNVTGGSAVIERAHVVASQTTGSGLTNIFRFANNAAGTLQGNGKLTYTNVTGTALLDWCYLSNAGTIAPTTGGSLTLQNVIVGNTGTINLNNSALTLANGSLNNAGGTVSIHNGGLLEANTITQPSGTMTNSGGIYQFSAASPVVNPTTAGTIILTNGIISFRAVTNANVKANWPGGNQLTNILYQGANAFRLDNATNSATGQSYTFGTGLGDTNYCRLELLNGSMYRGGTATIGNGGSLVVSNGTSTISNLTFASGSTLTVCVGTNASGAALGALNVPGTLTQSGATLNLVLGQVPAENQQYVIINVPGTSTPMTAFSSNVVNVDYGGKTYRMALRYNAGDGNDVAVVYVRLTGTLLKFE